MIGHWRWTLAVGLVHLVNWLFDWMFDLTPAVWLVHSSNWLFDWTSAVWLVHLSGWKLDIGLEVVGDHIGLTVAGVEVRLVVGGHC